MREFAVGQEFLVVWSRRRTSEPESFDTYTISKIGRDWVYKVVHEC
jgi:hypothetical protein